MDDKKLDEILGKLTSAHSKKRDMLLMKANAEIEAIQREDTAYYDGVYDAVKEIKSLLRAEETDGTR